MPTKILLERLRTYIVNSEQTSFEMEELEDISQDLKQEFRDSFNHVEDVMEHILVNEAQKMELHIDSTLDSRTQLLKVLYDLGMNFMGLVTDKGTARLELLLTLQAVSKPSLAQLLFDSSYGACADIVEERLKIAQKKNVFNVPFDFQYVAETLISVWQGLRFIRTRLGLEQKYLIDHQQHVKRAIASIIVPYMNSRELCLDELRRL